MYFMKIMNGLCAVFWAYEVLRSIYCWIKGINIHPSTHMCAALICVVYFINYYIYWGNK